jgi:hypothetical protein
MVQLNKGGAQMTWMSFGYKLTPELCYLIEAMKVEGYWSLKHRDATIQNKDLNFLREIEQILAKLNVKYSKRALIKAKIDAKLDKNEIKVFSKGKLITFHMEKNVFNPDTKKVVFKQKYSENQKFTIQIKNRKYEISFKENTELNPQSKLDAFAYLELRFHNGKLLRFLDTYCIGRKSNDIRIEKQLVALKPKYILAAFSALVDSEGSIDYYRHTRRLRIRMSNPDYLNDWKKALYNLRIESKVNKNTKLYQLTITSWQNFNKLDQLGFKLKHSKKAETWNNILKTYKKKQTIRNNALEFYLEQLKNIGKPISALEFAKLLSKSKRVVNHQLLRLREQGLISQDIAIGNGNKPPTYSIITKN